MASSNTFAGMENFHLRQCKYGLFWVRLGKFLDL